MVQTTAERVWLRPREAAEHLGVSVSTLYAWRKKGIVRFHRIGPRAVALRRSELDALAAPDEERDWRPFSRESIERLKAHVEVMRQKYGVLPDSTPDIRAERDHRG
jgi:excisionase family DNA binding protein